MAEDEFPTSEDGTPLGHDQRGNPLTPLPHDPPDFATPAPITDHDELVAQSGTKDQLEEVDRAGDPGEQGKGEDAAFRAQTCLNAPDSPLADDEAASAALAAQQSETPQARRAEAAQRRSARAAAAAERESAKSAKAASRQPPTKKES